jgi:hypothetical protein
MRPPSFARAAVRVRRAVLKRLRARADDEDMDSVPRSGEPFDVVFLRPSLRVASVLACAVTAAFFAWLAWTQPSRGHEFGYALAALCAWLTLYWVRVPANRVSVRDDGFEWTDTRFAALLSFPRRTARWADVTAVDTREVASRYGTFVRSRLTLRTEDGATRRVDVSSRDEGYGRFLDLLAARTAGRPLETRGMGVEAATVRQALHGIRSGQLRTVVGFVLLAGALVLIAFLTRH